MFTSSFTQNFPKIPKELSQTITSPFNPTNQNPIFLPKTHYQITPLHPKTHSTNPITSNWDSISLTSNLTKTPTSLSFSKMSKRIRILWVVDQRKRTKPPLYHPIHHWKRIYFKQPQSTQSTSK